MKRYINKYNVIVEIIEIKDDYTLYKFIMPSGKENYYNGKIEDLKRMLDFNGYKRIA